MTTHDIFLSPVMKDLIDRKLQKLKRFYSGIIIGKITVVRQTLNVISVKFKIQAGNKILHSSADTENFGKSLDIAVFKMTRLLKRKKAKNGLRHDILMFTGVSRKMSNNGSGTRTLHYY